LQTAIIQKHGIESLLDFGCRHGATLELLEVSGYLGFDPRSNDIDILRERYLSNPQKKFTDNVNAIKRKELAISFDVLFHLIKDSVYEDCMRSLFLSSTRFVLIYSSNTERTDGENGTAPHVRYGIFQEHIPSYFFFWRFIRNYFLTIQIIQSGLLGPISTSMLRCNHEFQV
jgi:hypothetical protein